MLRGVAVLTLALLGACLTGAETTRVDMAVTLPRAREYCSFKSGDRWGSVVCSEDSTTIRHCRVKNLVLDRSKLQLVNRHNEYKPAGSARDAFQMACASPAFVFDKEPIVESFGLSADNRPFGTHYIHNAKTPDALPRCDVTISDTAIMFNRDWHRNVWHRVANDIYQGFVAMRKFGLEDRTDLQVVQLDFAPRTFEDMYDSLIGSRTEWLRDWPESKRFVCFSDVLFMVSAHWKHTFPDVDQKRLPINPWVQEFRAWVTKRLDIGSLRTLFESTGRDLTITWISRNVSHAGFRAVLNEDAVIEHLRARLGPSVLVQKLDFDHISFADQVRVVRTTDVLFGVHGAALTHVLFLPAHAFVIEVLPHEFRHYFYEGVSRVVGVRHIEFMFSDRQQHYNCTWEPHSKFCNFVLPPEHIWPAFESAVRILQQERQ